MVVVVVEVVVAVEAVVVGGGELVGPTGGQQEEGQEAEDLARGRSLGHSGIFRLALRFYDSMVLRSYSPTL